jgi:hypothetical protein
MSDQNNPLMKVLEWVLDIDPPAIAASVAAERSKNPNKNNNQLACSAFSRTQWKAVSAGFVTGLPANPWVAVPAATTDVAITLKTEVYAAARTAIIYDDTFFDDGDAKWELLIPIFGLNAASQLARELGIKGAMGVTRAAIKKYLSKESLKVFKKIMLKYFGIKVTQKGIITKTLPIIGGLSGAVWNYIEVEITRKRTIAYFANGSI